MIVELLLFASMLGGDDSVGGEPNWGQRCLAAVGYAEARSESYQGEACVMRVVLNRALVSQRPICDIVLEQEQFARPTRIWEEKAWWRSQWLAQFVLADAWPLPDFCYTSLHFQQASTLHERGRIGIHGFSP